MTNKKICDVATPVETKELISPPLMGGDDLVAAGFGLRYHIRSKILDNPENGYYSAKTQNIR